VAIRRSSAPQTAALITDLTGNDAVRREAALARLAIAGARAVDPLLHALPTASGAAQAAILRALEMIAEPRTLPASIAALRSPDTTVALAAVGAVRAQLRSPDPPTADGSLEALTVVAIDASRSEVVRVAVIDALSDLGSDVLDAIRQRLEGEPAGRVRRAAGLDGPAQTDIETAGARLEAAAGGEADDPDVLRRLLLEASDSIALSTLHDLVLVFRRHERAARDETTRARWEAARAAAHVALGARGSRLALFDLRDALNEAGDAALETFVRAAALVGDASCLEPLTAAWRRAAADGLKDHVARAGQSIVAREHLTKRHAVVRRLLTRFPDAVSVLTTP
jgi:hypothetical protein